MPSPSEEPGQNFQAIFLWQPFHEPWQSIQDAVDEQGSSKDLQFAQIETWLFSAKIQGNHHLQGNVQGYNVRIPDERCAYPLSPFLLQVFPL